MKRQQVELDSITMTATPHQRGGPSYRAPAGTEYTVFELRAKINGIDLTPPNAQCDDSKHVDDGQIWLSQRTNRRSWLLTCTCGDAGCAGFHEPVSTSRASGRLTWTFPKSYFEYLSAQGLVSGSSRPVTFVFSARQVFEQFEAALELVRQHERLSGQPCAFLPGCHSKPDYRLDEQYARMEAWHLARTKRRRYARYIGTPSGICAGAPSATPAGNVK